VPDLPAAWQSVTLRQLMAHASGLPDYTKQPGFDPARDYKAGEILALVRSAPAAFKPGAQAAASATDCFLLALAIERASGMSYEAFVTKNQIERLSLKNTVFVSGLASVKQETLDAAPFKHSRFLQDRPYIDPTEAASGYTWNDGALVKAKRSSGTAWTGSGAIYASAADISLWDIGLAGGLLVSDKKNRDILYAAATIDGGASVPANAGWRFPKHKGLMDIEGTQELAAPGFIGLPHERLRQCHVLPHRKAREQPPGLQHDADMPGANTGARIRAFCSPEPGDIVSGEDEPLDVRGAPQERKQIDERALAAAGGAAHGHCLCGRQFE